ncbi:IclR family transcriptional regulator [Falsirhodobacter halotolerans]|uniref:IclR family transcriptional regulator n=1 Tax=Falsirhodobacter halotolerans TaxID=1146892 RepID=UPI001FD596F4|nr:helix-turn-helix domain-containing protein [Falsirhodobacter halotolerans]MCJ8139892.1 helix-turn-helix domain-containing protein [Falsirhodobacter halotolerans]
MSGRGIERILNLIEWFAATPGASSLSQVATALEMPKSSALQMLRTLAERGYVERDATGHYTLIRLPGEISADGDTHGALLTLAAPYIAQAVADVGETGFLAVLEGRDIRYLNKILPAREIRYDRDMSMTRPAHKVASGIVILAHSPADRVAEFEKSLAATEAKDLRAAMEVTRRDGFFMNAHGVVEGAAGVAAAIFDAQDRVIGAINISGPQGRMAEAADRVGAAALATARAVTAEIRRRAVRSI